MHDTRFRWDLRGLTNAALLGGLSRLVGSGRRLLAEVVAHLAEVEERRLHLDSGYGSMFAYCVSRLGLSEDEACRRIEAARIARRYPDVYPLLASGQLSLSVVALLKPYLIDAHSKELFVLVSGKSVGQARELLAARFPRPDVPSRIRKLPESQLAPRGTDEDTAAALRPLPFSGACLGHAVPASTPPRVAAPPDAASSSPPGPSQHQQPSDRPTNGASPSNFPFSNLPPNDPPSSDTPRSLPSSNPPPINAPPSNSASGGTPSESPSNASRCAPLPAAPKSATNVRDGSPVRSAKAPRVIEPLSAARYKIQLTADTVLKDKLELARDLMRHTIPDGDFAPILSRALDLLIEQLMKRRFGARRKHNAVPPSDHGAPKGSSSAAMSAQAPTPQSPSAPACTIPLTAGATPASSSAATSREAPGATEARSRSIPRSTRRTVSERDGLRCTWHGPDGARCESRAWLEHDHADPRGRGGGSGPENIRLLCRAHNQRAAELHYGRSHMADAIARAREQRSPSPSPASTPRD